MLVVGDLMMNVDDDVMANDEDDDDGYLGRV